MCRSSSAMTIRVTALRLFALIQLKRCMSGEVRSERCDDVVAATTYDIGDRFVRITRLNERKMKDRNIFGAQWLSNRTLGLRESDLGRLSFSTFYHPRVHWSLVHQHFVQTPVFVQTYASKERQSLIINISFTITLRIRKMLAYRQRGSIVGLKQ